MCGITGIYQLDGNIVSHEAIMNMNMAIAHRGPDGDGFWYHQDKHIAFGHRRLSILDLSAAGKQPMSFANGRYQITYNGEVFNFIELRNELRSKGYSFITDTDTEVIMAAYDCWGKECLSHFNGMWAFAIWDEQKQELFLARDHFGIKPLYYLHEPGVRFVFGSETNQFKYLNDYQRNFHRKHLLACLQNPFDSEGYGVTIYDGIMSLLPGHYIVLSSTSFIQKRWWSTLTYQANVSDDFENQVEEFRELFFDSCRLRLRSDVPIASALSGGLDSSSVYCTLHYLLKNKIGGLDRLPEQWQKAFVAIFPGTSQDETAFAEEAIRHVNGNAVFVEQKYTELTSDILNYTQKFDTIYYTPIHVLAKVYESMREHQIYVSMDGHGVDEMMYGYPYPLPEVIRYFRSGIDPIYGDDLLETYIRLFPDSERSSLKKKLLKSQGNASSPSFINKIRKAIERRLRNEVTALHKSWFELESLGNTYQSSMESSNFQLPAENDLYSQFHHAPLPVILRNFDKASMMSGVEIRMPFMDHRLVSYVFQLPMKSKIGNSYTKRILRESMKGILPDTIRNRTTKIGFMAPLKDWFDDPLKEFVMDTVSSSAFRQSSYWKGELVKKDTDAHYLKGKPIDFNYLWRLINAQIIINSNSK